LQFAARGATLKRVFSRLTVLINAQENYLRHSKQWLFLKFGSLFPAEPAMV
jgi:hypothetical protein